MHPDRQITLFSILAAVGVAIALLWRPITHFADGLWGPADPWTNGDFLGAYWMFWAAAQPENWVQALHHPWGEGPLLTSFPNPFDAWLLGPIVAALPFPGWWNTMTLLHHLGNVVATVILARALGARGVAAAAAGALVAASPIMLLEHTLGHTLTIAAWPGLLGLALLGRGRGWLAGLLIGVQGLAYLYTGLAAGLVALVLRPCRGLLLALAVVLPYLWLLAPLLPEASASAPPAGYTSLPLDGLFFSAQQPQFRVHPALLLGLVLPWIGRGSSASEKPTPDIRRRLALVTALLLLAAMGPDIVLSRGSDPLMGSPMAWLLSTVPGLGRMHHPVRLALLALPLLGVAMALSLQRRRGIIALALLCLSIPCWSTIDNTGAWPASPTPPGAKAARWLAKNGTAVVDLGSRSSEALALQPIHRLPVLSGFHPRQAPRPGLDPTVFQAVNAWSDGIEQPGLPGVLRRLGYSHVLVVDRSPRAPVDGSAVEAALGPPVFPGVYAL